MNNINTWYDFVLQQMAAESYLDGIDWSNRDTVVTRLENGNNHYTLPQDKFTSFTRMTDAQAKSFIGDGTAENPGHYDIVAHLPNTASGFSATLMRDKTTGEYTLSFRSM